MKKAMFLILITVLSMWIFMGRTDAPYPVVGSTLQLDTNKDGEYQILEETDIANLLQQINVVNVYEGDSIQAAIDAASAGTVIMIYPGTYTGQITGKAGITLRGISRKDVIIRYDAQSGGSANTTIVWMGSGTFKLCNLTAQNLITFNPTGGAATVIYADNAADIIVSDCDIVGSDNDTIEGGGTATLKFYDCYIETQNIQPDSIYLWDSAVGTFDKCIFQNTNAIAYLFATSTLNFYRNTILGAATNMFSVKGAGAVVNQIGTIRLDNIYGVLSIMDGVRYRGNIYATEEVEVLGGVTVSGELQTRNSWLGGQTIFSCYSDDLPARYYKIDDDGIVHIGDPTSGNYNTTIAGQTGNIDTTGDIDSEGHSAFGSSGTVDANYVMKISESSSTAASGGGLYVDVTRNPATGTNEHKGIGGIATYSGTSAGYIGNYGLYFAAITSAASGTIGTNAGVYVKAYGSGSGTSTIASNIGVQVASAAKGASQTMTTNYGVKVADQTAGSTNYSIYTGSGGVRFGDSVNTTEDYQIDGAVVINANKFNITPTVTNLADIPNGGQGWYHDSGWELWGRDPDGNLKALDN